MIRITRNSHEVLSETMDLSTRWQRPSPKLHISTLVILLFQSNTAGADADSAFAAARCFIVVDMKNCVLHLQCMLQLHVLHSISQWSGACAVLCHRSFPKALVGKLVCPLILSLVYLSYTYTGGSSQTRHAKKSPSPSVGAGDFFACLVGNNN